MRIDAGKVLCRLSLACALMQVALILGSWLWSAARPDSAVRSLLSPGGIRWFFGSFVGNEASPALVWIVLAGMAAGSLRSSGVLRGMVRLFLPAGRPLTSLQKFAARCSLALLAVEMAVVVLLTLPPHALLLSVTGELFPSSFSIAVVPIVAFVCVTVSVFYGLLGHVYQSLSDVVRGLCHDADALTALLLLYVLACQLCHSVAYVFAL